MFWLEVILKRKINWLKYNISFYRQLHIHMYIYAYTRVSIIGMKGNGDIWETCVVPPKNNEAVRTCMTWFRLPIWVSAREVLSFSLSFTFKIDVYMYVYVSVYLYVYVYKPWATA